jgi:uncharacterized membrane protein YgcG
MNEMTPAERVTLNALRATALAKMSDADFANLETEVANKGLRNLDGWFGAQVAKAVEQVLKHPGHANQASHGGGKGKGGASSSAPASSGGASSSQRQDEAADKVGMGANNAAENMGGHANEMQHKIYGKDGASKKMTPIDEVELMGINDSLISAAESLTLLSSSKAQGQYDQIINVRRQLKETRSDAVRQLSPAVRNIAVRTIDKHVAEVDDLLSLHREAWTGVGGTFEKAVEPVVKHPGHANQASHGGGKGGGGSSSAPASSGGGGGGASSPQAQVDAITGSPEFKASSQKLNDTVEAHRLAVANSKLPKSVKLEADVYLVEAQVARRQMKTAKTPSELSRAHGRAIDAGENYKGTIRAHQQDQRSAHYRKPMASPFKEKSVLPKGLEDYDVQDVAESMPIPFAD